MSEIAEYERRISFALERIGRGVELLANRRPAPEAAPDQTDAPISDALAERPEAEAAPAPDLTPAQPMPDAGAAEEIAQLRAALDAEREANAQLSERVRAIREKQDGTLGAMERKYGAAVRAQEAAFKEVAALKQANAGLIASNRKLMDEGVAFSDEALMAELVALRAERASEAAELHQILDGIAPLLEKMDEEAQDA
ncbi:hypothetical protein DL1_00985 [Thioclava dalianensis]|uniref:Uncharacterized protein n=1 Tax=Thioclava dalianensis TaxID=1185766 RepID=A0A074TJI7_9RHOB|nr:hypothetical protein [Thioclava dalianensis]KEP71774.1 hypothetical protein DL1_00985 [Thioclava dalianensis]SFN43054.1 hypothetical protein SAMN05216224_105188 [Thioclava dalianensis]